jgi:methionyl-tRNA formyltransferase
MAIKTIFFCGQHSPSGIAHLQPLIDSDLEIKYVVLADNRRWDKFYESLQGKQYYRTKYNQKKYLDIIKRFIKGLIPNKIIKKIEDIRNTKNIDIQYKKNNQAIINLLKKNKVPHIIVFDINKNESIQQIKNMEPDLIISAAYPQIFSKELISVSPIGAVNFHPSLLPRYRGAHPHFWAIAKGEKISGITAHFMTENLDDGSIIEQISFSIETHTYAELYDLLIYKTPELVKLVSDFFCLNQKKAIPQDLSQISYFRNDREIHHKIFFEIHSGEEIKNLVRTQKAYCFFNRERVIFWEIYIRNSNRNLTNNIQVTNGTIIDFFKENIVIKSQDSCIYLKVVNINGTILTAHKWAKKMNICIGEKFI